MNDMIRPKEAVLEEGKVICFRLITGDEIIGKITRVTRDEVSIKKPCTIMPGPQGYGLGPATLLGDPEHPVVYQRSAIVAIMKPRADAEHAYTTFETGLSIPPQQGLVMPGGR
jgi:hypothetical protein